MLTDNFSKFIVINRMYVLFHAMQNSYVLIYTYTQHLIFHCTYIFQQKINQVLFAYAEYWYTFVFANIGHISLCLRCVVVQILESIRSLRSYFCIYQYWSVLNLSTQFTICFCPYLYAFVFYRNLYAFTSSLKVIRE